MVSFINNSSGDFIDMVPDKPQPHFMKNKGTENESTYLQNGLKRKLTLKDILLQTTLAKVSPFSKRNCTMSPKKLLIKIHYFGKYDVQWDASSIIP